MTATINASTSSGIIQTADTSGELALQSNGTTQITVSSTGAYGQLKSGTSVSLTGTSVNFTSIPSWVKRITVMFSGMSGSGTSAFLVQLGTAGGVVSTGYTATGNAFNQSNGTFGSSSTAGFVIHNRNAADVFSGSMSIMNISSTNWVASFSGKSLNTVCHSGGGDVAIGSTITSLRVTFANGTDTFDAGSINIMYEG
jgi:hypothetical protein